MLLIAIFWVGGDRIVSIVFTSILGGGVEQSHIYPIYGAIIVLTGIIVGADGQGNRMKPFRAMYLKRKAIIADIVIQQFNTYFSASGSKSI